MCGDKVKINCKIKQVQVKNNIIVNTEIFQ